MVKLTQYSKAAGCGCKIAPAVLEEILKGHAPEVHFPDLLIGNKTKDDAAVFNIGNGNCVISTTDFFMPIVDDAYDFGRVASANAISDVYAMGGKPMMAIAILGWPVDKIPVEYAQKVLEGSRAVCAEAGIPLAGGHSVDSAEPIFGLAVTGLVEEQHIKRNNTVKPGNLVYLTKAIGTGILSTALKRGQLKPEHYDNLISTMCALNSIGEQLGTMPAVTAMTDVTGFGLIGHLFEMLDNTACSAELNYSQLPLLPELNFYTGQFIFPDNTTRNYNAYKNKVKGMDGAEFLVLCDPQTSGGLMFTVEEEFKEEVESVLKKNNLPAKPIGRIIPESDKKIIVHI